MILSILPLLSSCRQNSTPPVTVVETVEELFEGFNSGPLCITVAVLLTVPPAVGVTFTVNANIIEFTIFVPGLGSRFIEQVTVPGLPTGGVVQTGAVKAVPKSVSRFSETKVVPLGRVSRMTTLSAGLGPLFVAVSK